MSHEVEAGPAHDRLVDRSGHERIELPTQTTPHAPLYGREHGGCVAGIRPARPAGMNQPHGRYAQSAGAVPALVGTRRELAVQHFRAFAQHLRVGEQHGIEPAQLTGCLDYDIRPDSGRFANADREPGTC